MYIITKKNNTSEEAIMENYIICNCKNVSLFDVEDALHGNTNFEDVQKAFAHVQEVTHCSTGCGGCHQNIMKAISDLMYQYTPDSSASCSI